MREVYKFDADGNWLPQETIVIKNTEPVPEGYTDIVIPDGFILPKLVNGAVVEGNPIDPAVALQNAKDTKMEELDKACSQAIVDGFDYTLNSVSYRFSCSLEAQSNFTGADALFKDGTITSTAWTVVNNGTGNVERVTLSQTDFNAVKVQVFLHINTQISKFRDTLQPQVESCSTVAEVDAITW